MKESKTNHKLGTRLEHTQIAQTGAKKFKLKFTDYATEKYQAHRGSSPSKNDRVVCRFHYRRVNN